MEYWYQGLRIIIIRMNKKLIVNWHLLLEKTSINIIILYLF